MGYIARYFFVFGLCIIIAAASCTNNSPVAGAQKQLVGKWKIVKITTEEN